MTATAPVYLEHPEDILDCWSTWRQEAPTALVIIEGTIGGAVRAPGAMMAVSEDGRAAGYVSGGCIDADVILQARKALADSQMRRLRYGQGSPFRDLPLPCGGAIDILILPDPPQHAIEDCLARLKARTIGVLAIDVEDETVSFSYRPKLRIRVAGRGADPLAFARLAQSSGVDVSLWLRDGDDLISAQSSGFPDAVSLNSPQNLPDCFDDPWTAFVLMFHDEDWETPLLKQAVCGRAFYIGAVGSPKTHAKRCLVLQDAGMHKSDIARVKGPIGLIPSMRDASMLAVSTLAEIVSGYHTSARSALAETGVVLLAAGQSRRFRDGDKLLSDLNGTPLLSHVSSLGLLENAAVKLAVIGPDQINRQSLLNTQGWTTHLHEKATDGQGTSIAEGVKRISEEAAVSNVLILLGDMPYVPETHLSRLLARLVPGVDAVFTSVDGRLQPPAVFSASSCEMLITLKADEGAKQILGALTEVRSVPLEPALARDVDTREDLLGLQDANL